MVAPLLHRYVYGVVPPFTVRSIAPVESPLHNILTPDIDDDNRVGSVRVIDCVVEHPLLSLTVTLYVPGARLEICAVVSPVFHR